jgi:hypothetical protein
MKTRHIQIRVPEELADWFDENFSSGMKQQFGETCFLTLREIMERGELPKPVEYGRQAALGAVKKIASRE